MRKTMTLVILALLFATNSPGSFEQNAIQIGDSTFKIYIESVESGPSFPVYPDKNPPFLDKKTIDLKPSKGNILVKVKITIDNITNSKQSFKMGDIQLMCEEKRLAVVAAGLSDYPFAVKASDWDREKNKVEIIESRKDKTGGSYRFPIYIFEAPMDSSVWKVSYKGAQWTEVKNK